MNTVNRCEVECRPSRMYMCTSEHVHICGLSHFSPLLCWSVCTTFIFSNSFHIVTLTCSPRTWTLFLLWLPRLQLSTTPSFTPSHIQNTGTSLHCLLSTSWVMLLNKAIEKKNLWWGEWPQQSCHTYIRKCCAQHFMVFFMLLKSFK